MPNGKHGDNPISDFIVHGVRCFPPDIEDLLRRIDALGARANQDIFMAAWSRASKRRAMRGRRERLIRLL